ncbi:vWA domain-containing protein [Motilimonas eburnea]|uniref:vWA domain-containing protein n=1 Tax=Motilimonas eburnea TaxID=1737488 RepID=UPI001E5C4F4A|nr:VWA domain-containing protein [Motilimonas eburnea]MCE2571363.1 VWA domain-containing protein [Motilimonas eburnea]
MKPILSVLFIALACLFIWQANSLPPSETLPTSKSVKDNISDFLSSSGEGYGLQATKNDWPTLPQEQGVASSLLAQNYFIVFDGSGSMAEIQCNGDQTKLVAAKRAVKQFINEVPANANVGLLVFDYFGTQVKAELASANRDAIKQAIDDVQSGGGTPLKTSLAKGFHEIEKQAQQQLGYGEYNIVVVTDGDASVREDPSGVVDLIYQSSPVSIHTIGFCLGSDHALNQQGITFYKSAGDSQSLKEGLSSVLAESDNFTDIAQFN